MNSSHLQQMIGVLEKRVRELEKQLALRSFEIPTPGTRPFQLRPAPFRIEPFGKSPAPFETPQTPGPLIAAR